MPFKSRLGYIYQQQPETTMRIHLPFVPVACPRPRISMRGKNAVAYYPKKYTDFKKDIRAHISEHYFDAMFSPESIVKIDYIFVLPRPKYLMRKKDPEHRIAHTKKPDLDNLIKSINDAFEKFIFPNDSMIQSISAQKWIAAKDEEAHIDVRIIEVEYE